MAGPLNLSKPYDGPDDAAMGGFKKIVGNSSEWHTNEFGFWVILKFVQGDGKSAARYYDTGPEEGGNGHVEMTLPEGDSVVGNCHSHPHSYQTGDFSTADKRSYERLRKAWPGIAYHLLNPAGEIRRAIAESRFPAGTTVNWICKITP